MIRGTGLPPWPRRIRLQGKDAVLFAAALAAATLSTAGPASAQPAVGAIRWDAWIGDASPVGLSVEAALAPPHWHYRLPFFGREVGPWTVEARGQAQETVDREILLASEAGLSFWAYVIYAPSDPMTLALERHLSSPYRDRINFALILSRGSVVGDGVAGWPDRVARYVGYFGSPSYQRVTGGRPLVFLLDAAGFVGADRFATVTDARQAMSQLRDASVAAGHGAPYFVAQSFEAAQAEADRAAFGLDAVGAYAVVGSMSASPYINLAGEAEAWWDDAAARSPSVLPTAMAGWDRRPRIEHPHSWEPGQQPGVGMDQFYHSPTPQELRSHVGRAVAWVRNHPAKTPAGAVLVYAWNEIDEGGWLLPTKSDGNARLEALREVLAAPPAPPAAPPLPVTSGLLLHLRADDGACADGSLVSTWTDHSGAGHHATASGAARPACVHRALAGRPVLRFDGNDALTVGDVRGQLGPLSAFVVSRRLSAQLAGGQLYPRLLSSYDSSGPSRDWQAPSWVITADYSLEAYTHVGTTHAEGEPRAYAPDIRVRSDTSATLSIRHLVLGADASSGYSHFRGDLAEVLIYDRALDAAEGAAVRAYLDIKWLGAPAASSPPDAGTGATGDAGVPSWDATSPTPDADAQAARDDGGEPEPDVGTVSSDAEAPRADASEVPRSDAGEVPRPEAGDATDLFDSGAVPTADAGFPSSDSGALAPDSGLVGGPGAPAEGCGCRATVFRNGKAWIAAWLLAGILARRRRSSDTQAFRAPKSGLLDRFSPQPDRPERGTNEEGARPNRSRNA